MATRIFGLRKAPWLFSVERVGEGIDRGRRLSLPLFPLLPLTRSSSFPFRNGPNTLRDQRDDLQKRLKELLKALRKAKLVCGRPMVIKARVPIIKCELNFGVAVDISLGAVNGAAAVEYIQAQVIWG